MKLQRDERGHVFDKDMLNWYYYRHPVPLRSVAAMMLLDKGADVWRVEFQSDSTVEMLFIGLADASRKHREVCTADDMPEWMQDRVAALNVFGENYPTPYVEGVGRRINRTTYYVEE